MSYLHFYRLALLLIYVSPLNYPETIAYIASHLQEVARDGMRVAEVM
ncbi:urease subunit gamma [Haemophilus haemolyticus]|uniref:Urease subunit gamma n=1 Tax=Haemophilus haemolyticus TaxID=726 RepID=A0A852Q1J6_HAEHA|nr:urease subunit gamma [Haemophilus haemolyticus]